MKPGTWALLGLLGAGLVVAIAASSCVAACGYRGEQPIQVAASAQSGDSAPTGASSGATDLDAGSAPATPSAGAGAGPAAGTAASRPATDTGDSGATPQAAPGTCAGEGDATDVGVTSDRVVLGSVAQLSGVIQGFAATSVGGAQAYLNYRNAMGGVCGRLLELRVEDDRFSTADNRQGYLNLIDEVFAFTGGLSVVDDGGVQVLRGTDVADVGFALSDAKLVLENAFSPVPIPPPPGGDPAKGSNNAEGIARWLRDNEGLTTFALVWPNQATARNRALGYKNDFQNAGLTSVYEAEVAVAETNYSVHAVNIAERKADLLTTALEVQGMSQLAIELHKQGYMPPLANFGSQAYGQEFIKRAGGAAEGVRIGLVSDIVEGSQVPLTKEFATWFARTNPGLDADFFALSSWVAAHMLVTAMEAVGRNLTRPALLAELESMVDWDADGMIAPISAGKKIGPKCFLIAKVVNGHWVRDLPPTGFICP